MERWNGKVAVVTGASSGIGEALVKKLANYGMKVAALARRSERLQKLETEFKTTNDCKGMIKGIKCDVSVENDVKAAFEWIEQNWGAVHVLVNNAAVLIQEGLTSKLDLDKVSKTLNTNVIGTLASLKYGLQSMQKYNIETGHIFVINSIAGQSVVPMPGISLYCASKNAVRVLTQSLQNELSFFKSKIRVTSISPGLVETEMSDQFKEHMVNETPILKTSDIVDCIVYALAAPPNVNVSELVVQPTGESLALVVANLMKHLNI